MLSGDLERQTVACLHNLKAYDTQGFIKKKSLNLSQIVLSPFNGL